MKKILFIALFAVGCLGEDTVPIPSPDAANLAGLATPVEMKFSRGQRTSGSGFFYVELAPDDKKGQGPHWAAITNIYVVTAKHVIQPKRLKEVVSFTFALRLGKGDHVEWDRVQLNSTELGSRLHLCRNESVDVAVVEVTDKMTAEMKKLINERTQVLSYNGVNSDKFPGKSVLQVQPGDDVIVIGYPMGFFDTFNKLPVLKTGLLNTPIGMRFNGLDAFLLDFRYYEGSSGSLIISKPSRIAVTKEGLLQTNSQPDYIFLGVYQGEEVWNDALAESADLGLGWYYYNVEEAIKNPPLVQ
jgi:hypothetical protein